MKLGLKDRILKRFVKKRIITVFTEEVKIYAKYLNISQERILSHIWLYLAGSSRSDDKEGIKEYYRVLKVFDDRVKFYSTVVNPSLSETLIKEVIKEHLVKWQDDAGRR